MRRIYKLTALSRYETFVVALIMGMLSLCFAFGIAQASERFTNDIEPRYGEIDEPVHIVWGTDDTWIPVDRAHRLQRAIPHASLTLIEGAGHLVHLDAPAELAGDLVRWATATR